MTLNRTQFKRKAPAKEATPIKGPRQRKCKQCRVLHLGDKDWCSDDCAVSLALTRVAKIKAKSQRQERAADKAKRDGMKTYPMLIKEAQRAFNAYVRQRDALLPCICCGRTSDKEHLTGSSWDCGHYRSTGSAPHMRFMEDNAHRQLVMCNRYGAGRAVDYRIGLIARIGLARVEALESDNAPRKWSHENLRAIKAHYVAKLKQMKE